MPLALLLLVIALHLYLAWGNSFPGDHWALEQHDLPHPTWVRYYANSFQELGTPLVAITLIGVALLVLYRYGTLSELLGLVVACLAVPLNALLKLVLGPSPLWRTVHPGGHSYPSGHTTFTVAVIGYLGLLAWRHGRRWFAGLVALILVSVGPARVLTGIHLVSDVVAGYMLGAAVLLLAWRVAVTNRS